MGEGNQGAEPVPYLRRSSCPLAIAKDTPGLHHLYINQRQEIRLSTQGQLFLPVICTLKMLENLLAWCWLRVLSQRGPRHYLRVGSP